MEGALRAPWPDMVGIDRLVDAVAVNRLRDAKRSAAIVDVGTAITVDLVSANGAFLGGAILPGIAMAARALHGLVSAAKSSVRKVRIRLDTASRVSVIQRAYPLPARFTSLGERGDPQST